MKHHIQVRYKWARLYQDTRYIIECNKNIDTHLARRIAIQTHDMQRIPKQVSQVHVSSILPSPSKDLLTWLYCSQHSNKQYFAGCWSGAWNLSGTLGRAVCILRLLEMFTECLHILVYSLACLPDHQFHNQGCKQENIGPTLVKPQWTRCAVQNPRGSFHSTLQHFAKYC